MHKLVWTGRRHVQSLTTGAKCRCICPTASAYQNTLRCSVVACTSALRSAALRRRHAIRRKTRAYWWAERGDSARQARQATQSATAVHINAMTLIKAALAHKMADENRALARDAFPQKPKLASCPRPFRRLIDF